MKIRGIKIIVKKDKDDPQIREFHGRVRLSRFSEFYGGPDDVAEFNEMEKAPNNAYLLADKLFQIQGVQSVEISGYIVVVQISAAFQWSEVILKIAESIRAYVSVQKLMSDSSKD